jgi:hypothetical protein
MDVKQGLRLADDMQKDPDEVERFKHHLEGKLSKIKKYFNKKKLDYDMKIMNETVSCVKNLLDNNMPDPESAEELAFQEQFPDLLGDVQGFIKNRTESLATKYPDWLNCKITYVRLLRLIFL